MLPILILFCFLQKAIAYASEENTVPTIFKGTDYDSGCSCREYFKSYATCYDPENCVKFPRNFKTNLETFKLATSAVREIVPADFENYKQLKVLFLEGNLNLSKLESGAFRSLTSLQNLSISYNPNLMKLEDDVFDGLVNLKNLYIARNGFASMNDFAYALKALHMPNLKKLDLKDLNTQFVGKQDFINLNGSSLITLNFVNSLVEYIHPESLLPLKNLRFLRLGQNVLNASTVIDLINKMAEEKIPLHTLNLRGFGYRIPNSLFQVISNTSIEALILSQNKFEIKGFDINDSTFPYMLNIKSLTISNNLLVYLPWEALMYFPNVQSLNVSQNKFNSVPDGVLIPTIEILDLSMCTLNADIQAYFTLEKNKFKNMTRLKVLILFDNNIRKVSRGDFNGLKNLEHLNLKNCNIFFIDDFAFSDLTSLEYLNVEHNPFPTRSFTKDIFFGLKHLKHLVLANCHMKCIPNSTLVFEHLTFLEKLDLRGNCLKQISASIIIPLRNLKYLNVAENGLTSWHESIFPDQNYVEVFIASDNPFTTLTKEMLKDFSKLKEIEIVPNSLQCDCALIDRFIDFSKEDGVKTENILHIINKSSTYCLNSEKYSTVLLHDYYDSMHEYCNNKKMERLLNYVVPGAVLFSITLILTILSYFYRWHIRYWIFLTKLALSRRAQFHKRKNLQCHTNYLYDAFVSYSNEDRNFVVRLVSMLENYEPFLKLCVYERDFEIGTIISESVLECVSRSRKTLLIISNSYIKSQWCTWEAQVAEHHRLFFENEYGECVNDSIVMIKLGNISNSNISPMLRYLMKTRIYLQWDSTDNKQKQFWEKLRNALAPAPTELRNDRTIAIKL